MIGIPPFGVSDLLSESHLLVPYTTPCFHPKDWAAPLLSRPRPEVPPPAPAAHLLRASQPPFLPRARARAPARCHDNATRPRTSSTFPPQSRGPHRAGRAGRGDARSLSGPVAALGFPLGSAPELRASGGLLRTWGPTSMGLAAAVPDRSDCSHTTWDPALHSVKCSLRSFVKRQARPSSGDRSRLSRLSPGGGPSWRSGEQPETRQSYHFRSRPRGPQPGWKRLPSRYRGLRPG